MVQPLQASSGVNPWLTAPLPPPTPTSDNHETVLLSSDVPPVPTATPSVPADQRPGRGPTLNAPFVLQVGETGTLAEADFQLTLRSLTADSGCLTANDCAVMLAEGTLVLQQGDQREVLSFNVSFTPAQPFAYDFAGYVVELVHLKQGRAGAQLATFLVRKPTATVALPTPERIARCPHFSRFAAAAILQEAMAQEAVANLVFGPLAPDTTAVTGLCGYVTTAFSDKIKVYADSCRDIGLAYLEWAVSRLVGVGQICINLCYTQIRMKPLVSVSVRRTDQRI